MYVRSLALVLCLWAGTAHGVGVQSGGGGGGAPIVYPYEFAVLGCPHVGNLSLGGTGLHPVNWYQLSAFVDSMNVAGIDFMVIAGDWAQDHHVTFSPAAAETLTAIVNRADFPVYFCLGNHEAIAEDTLQAIHPYTTARNLRMGLLNNRSFGYVDWKNLRLIFIQNNANTSINPAEPASYRVNNPFNYGGVVQGVDYDGITQLDSPQWEMIDQALDTIEGRIPVVIGHRPVFGSSDNNVIRWSFLTAASPGGWMETIEDYLPSGHRGQGLWADQHIVWATQCLNDSSVSSATEAGYYHLQLSSGAGSRTADTTDTFAAGTAWMQAYVGRNVALTASYARTSEGIEDTLTVVGDPALPYRWFGAVFTVYGDTWVRRIYRVLTEPSETAGWYTGDGSLILVDERTLYMDVRGRN